MPLIQPDAEAYARMLKQLLPSGSVWRLDPDSLLSKLFLANGDELVRVSERVADLLEEADPQTTTELLPDFERVLALGSTGTDAERRARVVALLVRRQRVRPADFQQALALLLGQDVEDVVVIERGRAFAVAVDDDAEIFRFFVYRDPAAPGDYNIDDAQDVIDRMEPSHTSGHAIESIDALCDDEFSLCDRDILGEAGAAGGAPGFAFRKAAIAAFREALDGRAPSVLCLGKETDLIGNARFVASGTASASTLTGVSEEFGDDAYDFDGSGGCVWTCDDGAVAGVPAGQSRAYFMIFRPRSIPVSAALAGKQTGTSEGFNFTFNASVPRCLFRTAALGATVNLDLTATSAVATAWRCVGAAFDATNGEVRFASDLEAAANAVLPAERISPPGEFLRLGDSRTPPSTLNSADCELALFAEVQEDIPGIDVQASCAALLAKFLTG